MLEKHMVSNREFCNVTESGAIAGFQLKVRIPYYRGVFLSMLEDFRVTVDGELFPPDKLKFLLGDRAYTLNDLKTASETHWDFGQLATLIAQKPGGLATGLHTVEVGVLVRTSYELPPELDPQGIFRQAGAAPPVKPTLQDRYRFTWPAPGAGKATRKMTLVE